MSSMMKKLTIFGFTLLLTSGALMAQEGVQAHRPPITDPKVYIPLRESMTTMEMKFVDIQIMAAEEKIDFMAIQKALETMDNAAKEIQRINPKEALNAPLQKLSSQIKGLKRNARKKDKTGLKANLDLMFETCFKCHQAHAPIM